MSPDGADALISPARSDRQRIALAFEAGELPGPFDEILTVLRQHGTHVTVFVDGEWAESNPDTLRHAVADGHELGNHGFGHPDWTAMTDEQIQGDLERVVEVCRRIADAPVVRVALPPRMRIDDRVEQVLRSAGYVSVNCHPVDARSYSDGSPGAICQRALDAGGPGAVILMHTGRSATAAAVPMLLAALGDRSMVPVRVSELRSIPEHPHGDDGR